MMNLPHDVLLALTYVSQISDFDSVRSRFFESLNGRDEGLTFEFADHLPEGVPEHRVFPIITLHSSFGYAFIDEAHEPDADERAIFRNAFRFLAVLLENREQACSLESRYESFRKQVEDAFSESERKLSTLMDNLPGMAYRCKNDVHWTMEFVSSGCLYLTGYKAEKIINNAELSFGDLVHPDDRDRVFEEVRKGIENQQPFLLEYRIRDKAGNERWVWEQAREVDKDSDGREIIEGFIMDITDRIQAEKKLHRLKDNLAKEVAVKTRELKERVAELERFHDATIEREFRIKELRDEIERLKRGESCGE